MRGLTFMAGLGVFLVGVVITLAIINGAVA